MANPPPDQDGMRSSFLVAFGLLAGCLQLVPPLGRCWFAPHGPQAVSPEQGQTIRATRLLPKFCRVSFRQRASPRRAIGICHNLKKRNPFTSEELDSQHFQDRKGLTLRRGRPQRQLLCTECPVQNRQLVNEKRYDLVPTNDFSTKYSCWNIETFPWILQSIMQLTLGFVSYSRNDATLKGGSCFCPSNN